VVLAVQDRLAYGPTFEAAMAAMFGGAPSTLNAQGSAPGAQGPAPATAAATASPAVAAGETRTGPSDLNALISDAARDLADYQQLTAAGKLGEAGQKLEHLKLKLEELQRRRQ